MNKGCIALDLDGTAAIEGPWLGPEHIGEPNWPVIERAKRAMADGVPVWIFSSRLCLTGNERVKAMRAIEAFCSRVFGQVLPMTERKLLLFTEIWDNRAVHVATNTGKSEAGGALWDRYEPPPGPLPGQMHLYGDG